MRRFVCTEGSCSRKTFAEQVPGLTPWPTGHRFAERTSAKHATVHALLAAGHSKRSIARQLGMGLNTVLCFSRATEPERLFTGQWQCRPTKPYAYKPCLDQRWQEGRTNAWKPWEEIKAQGSPDGYGNVRAYVSRNLRGKPQPVGPRPPSARAVSRWILTHPDAPAESDRLQLKAVLAGCSGASQDVQLDRWARRRLMTMLIDQRIIASALSGRASVACADGLRRSRTGARDNHTQVQPSWNHLVKGRTAATTGPHRCFSGFNTQELHRRPCLYAAIAPRPPERDCRSIGNRHDRYGNYP
ncbi:hypothetical protein [Streptomyces sp. NBC_00328]|uniref:hypothetical protein n=1 Tax=Streptomyces sp. NBC_00328 TaxID=2903646 RepID=UPI002E2814C1|nr:hypothetical protein [Streptomyces sp. NBC_00328]